MGTSPPSGNDVEVIESTGPPGPFPFPWAGPFPPAGCCAKSSTPDARARVVESKTVCIVLMGIVKLYSIRDSVLFTASRHHARPARPEAEPAWRVREWV